MKTLLLMLCFFSFSALADCQKSLDCSGYSCIVRNICTTDIQAPAPIPIPAFIPTYSTVPVYPVRR